METGDITPRIQIIVNRSLARLIRNLFWSSLSRSSKRNEKRNTSLLVIRKEHNKRIGSIEDGNSKNLDPIGSMILDAGCGSILILWCHPLKLPASSTDSPISQY